MKICLYAVVFLLGALPAFSQVFNTWSGNADANWHNAANWSMSEVPSACQDVVIPVLAGKPYPILNGDGYVKNIHIRDGAQLFTNNHNIFMGFGSTFSVVAKDTAVNCTPTWPLTLTASITGIDSSGYTYVWTGPDGIPIQGTEESEVIDTLIVNTPRVAGITKDSATTVIFFKPGFVVNPGADYTARIANASKRSTKLMVSAPGDYILTVTENSTGCSVSDTATVTQTGAFEVAISGINTLTCKTDSLTLGVTTSATNLSYSWTGPGISSPLTTATVTVTQPGNYGVTVTSSSGGCPSSASAQITQNIAVPQATLAGGMLSCNVSSPLVLAPSGVGPSGVTYQWSGPGISSGQNPVTPTLEALAPGTYQVTITDPANGCSVEKQAVVTVNPECPLIEECPVVPGLVTNQITYERWNNITGTTISAFTGSSKFAQAADTGSLLTSFSAPTNVADNYGTRIRGYVTPPVSGQYTFWIAADESAELWLSTSDNPADKVKIAFNTTAVPVSGYGVNTSQQSAQISLQCGQRYYIEALAKEATGDDHLSVSWQIPGQTWDQQPIAGQYLADYGLCAFAIASTPTDKIELATGETVKLSIQRAPAMTDSFNWSTAFKHFVSSETAVDSTETKSGTDDVFIRAGVAGEFVYRATSSTNSGCYKEYKVTVTGADCACQDCDLVAVKESSNPGVSESAAGTAAHNYVTENIHLTSDGSSVAQSITYLDGLGRPIQQVSREAGGALISNLGQVSDLIQPIEYDALGRESKKYLPYAASDNSGSFVTDVVSNQATYYTSIGKAGSAFTNIVYENSSLNRVVSQTAPGSGIAVQILHRGNTAGDNVKLLNYNFSTSNIEVTNFAAGKLYVTETTDENNNKTVEFKDTKGQVVCKEVSARRTYYAYDDFGLLRCVIPPKAASLLSSSSFDPLTNDLLFVYTYDARGRMISKKVPGAGLMTMTYDTRDRLLTSTDAKGQVTTNVYDDLDRITAVKLGGDDVIRNYYDAYPAVTDAAENYDQVQAYGITRLTAVKGMLTASENKDLQGGSFLRTVNYYDGLGRTVQVVSRNHKGSFDRSSSRLDFAGRVTETQMTTRNSLLIQTRTSYDRGGRTKAVCQMVSDLSTGTAGGSSPGVYWEPVGRYSYNGIGELTSKTLGCNIQKVDYAYNMRGWMTDMNNPAQLVSGDEKDFFAMHLGYDAVGNITTWDYRSAQRTGAYGDTYAITPKEPYAYTFSYDNLYRIKTANLNKSGTTVFTLGGTDGGAMGYDDNGNITSLSRTFNGGVVDNLAYSYTANTNKLSSITDGGTNPSTPNAFFAANASYTYDANGNLVTDSGKGISAISYNHLNLPQSITKSSQTITYDYAASGAKLKANFGAGKVYDYISGLVYVNDTLEFIPTAEGRILPPGRAVNPELNDNNALPAGIRNTFYRYEYQMNDHLGNLRVACRCGEKENAASPAHAYAPIVVQENHYDPWGLDLPLNADAEKVKGSPVDRFTYNGKEMQQSTDWLDYGARMYDPATGRWIVVDPLAEKMSSWSVYNYTFNNPLKFTDKDGTVPDIVISGSPSFKQEAFINLQKLSSTPLSMLPNGKVVESRNVGLITGSFSITGKVEAPLVKPVGTELVTDLIRSDKIVTIVEAAEYGNRTIPDNGESAGNGVGTSSTVEYDPSLKGSGIVNEDGSEGRPSQIGLAHELGHARHNANGQNDKTKAKTKTDPDTGDKGKLTNNEISVRKLDSVIRKEQGAKERKQPY